jgi:hypothetical protein
MSSLSNLVAEVIEDLKKYNVTNENTLDYELIADKLVAANVSVLGKFVSQHLPLDGFYQIISGIQVTCEKDKFTVGNFVFTDKSVYFKADLPPLIKTIGYSNIKYFGLAGWDRALTRLDLLDLVSRKSARWSSELPVYATIGDTLIAKNLPEGLSLAVGAFILEDPRQAPGWDDETSDFPSASIEGIKIIVKNAVIGTPLIPDIVGGVTTTAQGQGAQKPSKPQQTEE